MEAYIGDSRMQISDAKIVYHDDGFVTYDFILRLTRDISISELTRLLKSHGEVRSVSVIPVS